MSEAAQVDHESTHPGRALLHSAAGRTPGNEASLPIRELIGHWGAKRRSDLVVAEIRAELNAVGLVSVPSFESGWIDNQTRLVRIRPVAGHGGHIGGVSDGQPATSEIAEVALTVGSLKSSSAGVVSVCRDDSLAKVKSLMMAFDYSQLPVLQGLRNLTGAVSWESIAQARMRDPNASLRDCTVPADVVAVHDDLLNHIPRIAAVGYVFVRDGENKISGIVTTADLSQAFLDLAGPFLLIGEVERRLRRIATRFSLDVLCALRDPADTNREIRGVDDLTMGEYLRLFACKERWTELNWDVDREVFVGALDLIRELRNEVMHFNPDPIEPERLERAQHLLKWLKLLDG